MNIRDIMQVVRPDPVGGSPIIAVERDGQVVGVPAAELLVKKMPRVMFMMMGRGNSTGF